MFPNKPPSACPPLAVAVSSAVQLRSHGGSHMGLVVCKSLHPIAARNAAKTLVLVVSAQSRSAIFAMLVQMS